MTNSELMRRWFEEVWNERNPDVIDELFAVDGIANGISDAEGNPVVGPEKYKPFQAAFLQAYPDLKITVEDTVSEGEKVAVRCRVTGTHCGDGIGITPCNTSVDFTFMGICRFENGKIAEAWNNIDFMEMYKQLGVLKLDLK